MSASAGGDGLSVANLRGSMDVPGSQRGEGENRGTEERNAGAGAEES